MRVIAGLMPIDILAMEKKRLHESRSDVPEKHEELEEVARRESLKQSNWEVNYYRTRMLSNHRRFRTDLHSLKCEEISDFPVGSEVPKDAEHGFFTTSRYDERIGG
uniref:Uncharacterized protein n=1 Tax=Bracon brevicornis TaxID=1563983 RepID=A0A6V7LMD6_9HYME